MIKFSPVSLLLAIMLVPSPISMSTGIGTPAMAATTCFVPFGKYPTIASAINDPACSVVNVDAGAFHEHGLVIDRNLIVDGAGAGRTVIDGDSAEASVFKVAAGTTFTLKNVRIINGNAPGGDPFSGDGGGAINSWGTLTVINSAFVSNKTSGWGQAGAIQANGPQTRIAGCLFEDNFAEYRGGAIVVHWDPEGDVLTVTSTRFIGNRTSGSGGAIYDAHETTINDSVFIGNRASRGAAIGVTNTSLLTVRNSIFRDNATERLINEGGPNYGGAIDANGPTGALDIRGSSFVGNNAPTSPEGPGYGGAINTRVPTIVMDSEFRNNAAAGNGGAILNANTLTLRRVNILNNTAGLDGGGIYNDGGTVMLKDSKVKNNVPNNCGGPSPVPGC